MLIAAVALANVATPAVAGSCGHYLFRNGKPVHSSEMSVEPTLDSQAATQDLISTSPVPSKPQPCRGPGCRRGAIPLAPVPAPFQMTVQTELAVLFELLGASNGASGFGFLPFSERLPNPCVDEIFRPPANV